ncbi:MAG: hydrogenase maturation nickel metallochaperone HypA [Bacteroidota bacterium]
MHELSLVNSIVETCEETVRQHGGKTIQKIVLEMGTLSGVERDAFEFVWSCGVENTVLHHAKKEIITPKAQALCRNCQQHYYPEIIYDACPECGSFDSEWLKGRTFMIKSIIIK